MLSRAYYDLHIHSALSPCGDDEMTPASIAGMAYIKGLNVVALTDHNTCGNCSAFTKACDEYVIISICGAELTTSEDIHILSLFETLEGALEFDLFLKDKRNLFPNEPSVFGNQYYMDEKDNILSTEPSLLINALDISIDDVSDLVLRYGGVAIPSHIEKSSNSVSSILGTVPNVFPTYEVSDLLQLDSLKKAYPFMKNKVVISDSDAHVLWNITEKENYFELSCDLSDKSEVIKEIFHVLKGGYV